MAFEFETSQLTLFVPSPENLEDDINTMLTMLEEEESGGDQVPLCEVRDMIEKLAVYAVNLHPAITALQSKGVDVSHFVLEGGASCSL